MTSAEAVALVTGGTRGIGRAVSAALLEDGAAVAITARTAADVQDVVEELRAEHGERVLGLEADVRERAACDRAVQETVDWFGRLSILVNNAGVGRFGSIETLSDEDWDRQIGTNLTGVFYCSRAAVPHLRNAGGGWIINIGSLAGRNAFAGGAAYNASKFGLLGMSEAMMLDLRHDGIRVTCVMPGSVNTGFLDREPDADSWKLASEDVARAVSDLLRYPGRAHPSRIELRPSMPPRG